MKERAEMAGGTINIDSNTTGTTLSVAIPLKK
jgi:signal transduction histidine kinase